MHARFYKMKEYLLLTTAYLQNRVQKIRQNNNTVSPCAACSLKPRAHSRALDQRYAAHIQVIYTMEMAAKQKLQNDKQDGMTYCYNLHTFIIFFDDIIKI